MYFVSPSELDRTVTGDVYRLRGLAGVADSVPKHKPKHIYILIGLVRAGVAVSE